MDVSLRVHPEALVGRVLRVFWRTDDAWFPGGVESYDASTGRHKVGPAAVGLCQQPICDGLRHSVTM
jgi:hypothetical protein